MSNEIAPRRDVITKSSGGLTHLRNRFDRAKRTKRPRCPHVGTLSQVRCELREGHRGVHRGGEWCWGEAVEVRERAR